MAYLTPAELNTHLYDEVATEISRNDQTKLQFAINAAIQEAYGFLSKYDRTLIFESVDDNRNPILLLYIKDIAVWHYIQLANVTIDLALRERRYEMAIDALVKIQKGTMTPDLPVPLPDDDIPQSGDVRYGGNRIKQVGFL